MTDAQPTGEIGVLGFTGSRHGMTPEQVATVDEMTALAFGEVHHGDCVGADLAMDYIARVNGQRRIIHPPSDPRLRAWCDGDVVLPEKPYHDRNRDIVDACTMLIATPAEASEQPKGGTWYTVRYAREQGKPVMVVWPDGTVLAPSVTDRSGS